MSITITKNKRAITLNYMTVSNRQE